VDWECEVEREFAPENLGCRRRMSSGLDWVFERCEEAIVLEDDCVPDPTYFPFCEALLARWRDEPRVMAITGDNFQEGVRRGEGSYYFSRFMHVWGWASWRRAWRHYDVAMASWPERRAAGWLAATLGDEGAARYWTGLFDRTHAGEIDTWDYQLLYAVWEAGGLVATPNVNLVSNVGAGPGATNTHVKDRWADLPTHPVELPLRHPAALARDVEADAYVQRTHYAPPRRRGLRGLWDRLAGG
jgi:hypothetical protein